MNWQDLPLKEKHELLTRLRVAVVLAVMGDDSLIRKMIGDDPGDIDQSDPLPDSAGVADAVNAWLAGGAA